MSFISNSNIVIKLKAKLTTYLLENPTRKGVIQIAWPVLTELLLGSLFGMVDMMMLGRIKNTAEAAASVAAVGITNQPMFICLALVQALNVGGTAMVARYVGAKQAHRIDNIVKHVVLLNLLLLALPLSILGITFTDKIMSFLGAQNDTIAIGRLYFKIIMVGLVFQSLNFSLAAALRGAGDTKMPMGINLKVNFLNVIGNMLLIYGLLGFPRLGVIGAAVSTALSQVLASILLFYNIIIGKSIISFNFKNKFSFNRDTIYNLVKIGIPASLEQIVMRAGLLMFVKIVASLGTTIFAAHQVSLNIFNLSFQPGQAFGIAASSLVGQNLGAGNPKQAELYAKEARRIGSIISSSMAVLFFVFGPQLVSLYTTDPEIIKSASTALKIIAVVQPFQSSQLILAGGLRGAGDTISPLISTFIGILGVRVALSYLFVNALGYGLAGAWMAVLVDQLVRWALIYIRFQSGKWKYVALR